MLRSRFSGSVSLVFLIAAITVLGAQTASADGDRRVHIRFAGDFIQYLEQTDAVAGIPTGPTSLLGVVRAKAKGNLGRADLTAAAKGINLEEPEWDARCPDYGFFLKVVDITDNSLVFTFSDLSLLYGNGQGVVCINLAEGEQFLEQYIAVEGEWLGGTGRFRNAKGEFSIQFDDYVPVNPNTQIVAETGKITGTLSRDR
jgi:hypothetical protein